MDRDELIKIAESNVLPHYAIVSEIREKEPKIIVKGKGAKIYDIDGKEYIDGLSILWTVNIGHGRQEIIDALKEQLEKIKALMKSPADVKLVDDLTNAVNTHKTDLTEFIETWNNIQKLNSTRGQAAENVLTTAQNTATKGIEQTSNISTKANTSLSFSSSVMIIGLIMAIIIGF
ncbi:MAG TPA: aminotransferase class III-fold pyridoxal phosphate-dependent enzyme, partial [Caldisericia bacterium]|nr:aminotransferase class III-fold pyridoxal phosphate-dependent enzyme [Caldisericia bacterium]